MTSRSEVVWFCAAAAPPRDGIVAASSSRDDVHAADRRNVVARFERAVVVTGSTLSTASTLCPRFERDQCELVDTRTTTADSRFLTYRSTPCRPPFITSARSPSFDRWMLGDMWCVED